LIVFQGGVAEGFIPEEHRDRVAGFRALGVGVGGFFKLLDGLVELALAVVVARECLVDRRVARLRSLGLHQDIFGVFVRARVLVDFG
jgi:hypothetical protein